MKVVVSYGGGTNSTAILVGLHERGQRPDAIVFSDTGGEKPETYAHIQRVREWCAQVGFPDIDIVKGRQPQMIKDGSLEGECLRLGVMPGKAYGRASCSLKWKVEPHDRYVREKAAEWGVPFAEIICLVGFDADEIARMERALTHAAKNLVRKVYPLIEWDWGREECVEAIARAGLPQPGKSACFFCPSSKKHEILWLRDHHPELLARALEIERRARSEEGEGSVEPARCGLGRGLVWADFLAEVEQTPNTCNMSNAAVQEMDCGCFDGD